jgi:hypothetical protein
MVLFYHAVDRSVDLRPEAAVNDVELFEVRQDT